MGAASSATVRAHPGSEFGLFTPAFFQDPYSVYRRVQADHPVLRLADGLFLLTRHEDCRQVLRQRHRSREIVQRRPGAARLIGRRKLIAPIARRALIFTDEPEHGRTRRLIHQAYTPGRVKELGDRVPEMVETLVAGIARSERFDVIHDIAYPLLNAVTATLLGIPEEHRATIRSHAAALTRLTEPLSDLRVTSDAARGARAMQRIFTELVDERRRHPADDLVSSLAHAETDDGTLATEQIVANCILLLNASEVTVGLIGNAVLALLRHPEQLARFRDDPSIRADAIDELLRYDAPTPFVNRIAGDDDVLEDGDLVPGDTVVLAIGAANRDPNKFECPDELDIERPDSQHHLSFANGIHYCLGSGLARAMVLPTLTALLADRGGLRLAVEHPRFRHQITFRCLESLPVSFDAARA